jgi:ubiquinone/menaquinone biosynthesis C-methylase UbiE
MTNNKKYFLINEADEYYKRNRDKKINFKNDFLCKAIENDLKKIKTKKINFLEIGCGDAQRLFYLKEKFPHINFFGIDPSKEAIKSKKKINIKLLRSTAEKLPFRNSFFDIIVYGFCLYLVDDQDLIKVVSEADRVTKRKSLIVIYDFYKKKLIYRKYKHKRKIYIRKMDYSKMFSWLPGYKILKFQKKLYPGKKDDFLSLVKIKKEIIK